MKIQLDVNTVELPHGKSLLASIRKVIKLPVKENLKVIIDGGGMFVETGTKVVNK